MKILILQSDYGDYDSYTVSNDACLIVPDDFSEETLGLMWKRWLAETWKPKLRGGKLTKRTYQTVPFVDWMKERFESVEFLEYCA